MPSAPFEALPLTSEKVRLPPVTSEKVFHAPAFWRPIPLLLLLLAMQAGLSAIAIVPPSRSRPVETRPVDVDAVPEQRLVF